MRKVGQEIENQLMGQHQGCMVCPECFTITAMERMNDYMKQDGSVLQAYCRGCGRDMFTMGFQEDSYPSYSAKIGLDMALDALDRINAMISNVNTDDELEKIEKLIEEHKEDIEDSKDDLGVING